jgi:hypothetical protein
MLGHKPSRYKIWVTKKKPYLQPISYELNDDGYIAKQIGSPLTAAGACAADGIRGAKYEKRSSPKFPVKA